MRITSAVIYTGAIVLVHLSSGADVTYDLNGAAPYYWSTMSNWSGGALPAAGDNVTVSQPTLLTSPLTMQSSVSSTMATLYVDKGILNIEPGASLTAANGSAGGISIAKSWNATGVVTNRGTVTTYDMDFGVNATNPKKGALACFDNFGTLAVNNALRLQQKGTPSLLYNHAGATVRKAGGNEWSFRFGMEGASGSYSRVINEGDFFDNSKEIWVGVCAASLGLCEIVLDKNGRFFAEQGVSLGHVANSRGVITMNGSSLLSGNAAWCIGGSVNSAAANAEGLVSMHDSSRFVASNYVHVGHYTSCSGQLLMDGNSRLESLKSVNVGYGASSIGLLSLEGSVTAELGGAGLRIADGAAATGHVVVAGNALMSVTNIYLCPTWNASTGILEVAGSGVITNVVKLTVGQDNADMLATLKMSGGAVFFDGTASDGYPLNLDATKRSADSVRGWGTVAFVDPVSAVRDAAAPVGIRHYGMVVADGGGGLHDLDFSHFGVMKSAGTEVNPRGTNGWYAVNGGRLKLPRCLPRKTASYRCVGDYWTLDYSSDPGGATTDALKKRNRLANTFTCTFTGAALNNYIFAELYATDRSDIPSGLDGIGADKVVSVWRTGLFTDDPDSDEPTHPDSFGTAKIYFKYPAWQTVGMNHMYVYRHDGTATGKWRLVGRAAKSGEWSVVPAKVSEPSVANWNLGWFAVVGRTQPLGMTIVFR